MMNKRIRERYWAMRVDGPHPYLSGESVGGRWHPTLWEKRKDIPNGICTEVYHKIVQVTVEEVE